MVRLLLGKKVFVWVQDTSKFKDRGTWVHGRVVSQSGPMVLIETRDRLVRVNQCKVRKNRDPWHDAPMPALLAEAEAGNDELLLSTDSAMQDVLELGRQPYRFRSVRTVLDSNPASHEISEV